MITVVWSDSRYIGTMTIEMRAGIIIAHRGPSRSDTSPQLELARNTNKFDRISGVAISAGPITALARWLRRGQIRPEPGNSARRITAARRQNHAGCRLPD